MPQQDYSYGYGDQGQENPFQGIGLSPEVVAGMMQAGIAPEKLKMLQEQMGRAEQLRMQQGPQGRDAGRGGFVAANPLEHLGTGIQQYRGGRQMGKLRGKQDKVLGDLAGQREKSAAEIIRALGGGGPRQRQDPYGGVRQA